MALTKIRFENFTAFRELTVELSPGVNIFIGENGTGKTHILKAAYAACEVTKPDIRLFDKLMGVFRPYMRDLTRLANNGLASAKVHVSSSISNSELIFEITKAHDPAEEWKWGVFVFPSKDGQGMAEWQRYPIDCIYLPVKDILADAAGFRSLYEEREVEFEEIYFDILNRAFLPPLREIEEPKLSELVTKLEEKVGGKTRVEGETFFLESTGTRKPLEFHLVAEGIRKLALLWILIRNGSIKEKTIIFWDEPEANLNPKLYGVVVDVLLELQRIGCQILLATHDYVVLKEFDLQTQPDDKVVYHSLYREKKKKGDIQIASTDSFLQIDPNAIADTFSDLFDRDVKRALSVSEPKKAGKR